MPAKGIFLRMNILFVTDLHGNAGRYERALALARVLKADAVVNGGDMLPNGGDPFTRQRGFITDFLGPHFAAYVRAGIRYLCMPGNDDLRIHDQLFQETCAKHPGVHSLAQQCVAVNDIDFIGMNLVADYPFRLKDRCRIDAPGFKFPMQFGSALVSTDRGAYHEIADWKRYARSLPSIEDALEILPDPRDLNKAVYVIHMPPSGLGLDVCGDGRRVGSGAVNRFLSTRQPAMSLHGHIHESPVMSGVWKARLGRTICVQPGQVGGLSYATVDTAEWRVERFVEE